MRNIILLACLLVAAVVAVPVPETPKNIELVQIPLRGNKVSAIDKLTFYRYHRRLNVSFQHSNDCKRRIASHSAKANGMAIHLHYRVHQQISEFKKFRVSFNSI